MSEISWYQCHLFYLLPLLLILCQETQCTKSCESSILARISGGFLLNSNSNVLPMNSGRPLQLHAKGACSLPLPVLVTVLEKWCPCFSRWHSFLSPSCPWVWQSRGQAHLPSFHIFIFWNHDYGPDKGFISILNKNEDRKGKLQTDKEKVFANRTNISDKGLQSKIYKELSKLNGKKQIIQLENGENTWWDMSMKANEHKKRWSNLVISEM